MSNVLDGRQKVYQALATLTQACQDMGLRASGTFAIRDDRRGYVDWSFDTLGDVWSEALYIVPENAAEAAEFIGQHYGQFTSILASNRSYRGTLQPRSDASCAVVSEDGKISPVFFADIANITVRVPPGA